MLHKFSPSRLVSDDCVKRILKGTELQAFHDKWVKLMLIKINVNW